MKGHAALQLTARNDTTGLSLSPYTIERVDASATYIFSIWVKGAKGNELIAFNFNQNIFTVTKSDSGMEMVSNCAVQVTATTTWALKTVHLVSTSDPTKACPYNCRSWLTYQLTSTGSVWLDEMKLSEA